MNGKDEADRPDWYVSKMKAKKLGLPSAAGSAPSGMTRQSSMKAFMLPKLSPAAQQAFDQHMAMHYYVTGTSFQRVEECNLLKAVKSLRPDAELPSLRNPT